MLRLKKLFKSEITAVGVEEAACCRHGCARGKQISKVPLKASSRSVSVFPWKFFLYVCLNIIETCKALG